MYGTERSSANLPHLRPAIYPNAPTISQHTKDSLLSHSMWRYSNKAFWSWAISYFSHWHDLANLQTLATLTNTTRGFAPNQSQAPCTTLVVHVVARLLVELVWATTPFFAALSIKSTNWFLALPFKELKNKPYLYRFHHFHQWFQMWQNKNFILLFRALTGNFKYTRKNKRYHSWLSKVSNHAS